MQSDGFYRDKNGKTMVPLIMFKRTSFEKDNTLGNKLDGNRVQNVQYFETQYSKRNNYDNFSILQNQKPQKEYILGVIPDYITISYDMSIFTDFTEQMNEITEAIEFAARLLVHIGEIHKGLCLGLILNLSLHQHYWKQGLIEQIKQIWH